MRERLDRLGRPYKPMMVPELRVGQRPANFGKTYPVEILTPREVGRMLAACARRGPSGLRNRAMIVVMWRGGLRVAELVDLEPRDVDVDTGIITVRHGKGDKRRVVALEPEAMAVVVRWIEARAKLAIPRGRKLFCTITRDVAGAGRPLRTAHVREIIREHAQRAGIEKRVHPHGLRHTWAVGLLEDGVDVKTIQLALGHKDLRTTDRYLNHLSGQHVVKAMRARTAPPELLAA